MVVKRRAIPGTRVPGGACTSHAFKPCMARGAGGRFGSLVGRECDRIHNPKWKRFTETMKIDEHHRNMMV